MYRDQKRIARNAIMNFMPIDVTDIANKSATRPLAAQRSPIFHLIFIIRNTRRDFPGIIGIPFAFLAFHNARHNHYRIIRYYYTEIVVYIITKLQKNNSLLLDACSETRQLKVYSTKF